MLEVLNRDVVWDGPSGAYLGDSLARVLSAIALRCSSNCTQMFGCP